MTDVDTAVVPVAGLATRVQPLARTVPKEMLPLGDRPVLHYVVEELIDAGVRHIVLVVGAHSESIERYFHHVPELDERLAEKGTTAPLGSRMTHCTFSFVRQDRPLGVVDAVSRAARVVGDRPYFVHMGDSIVWKDNGILRRMVSTHGTHPADATMAVSWRLPHHTSSRAVTEPIGAISGRTRSFQVRRVRYLEHPDQTDRPFFIGRYLLEGPMPARRPRLGPSRDRAPCRPDRFGGLTPLFVNGERAKVMAVPLLDEERLLGVGTLPEYFVSWRTWLAENAP